MVGREMVRNGYSGSLAKYLTCKIETPYDEYHNESK